MSIFRILAATLLLSGAALADEAALIPSVATPVISGSVPSNAVMPSSALPHNSRTIVLVIGVGAVLVTFQRALSPRRKNA